MCRLTIWGRLGFNVAAGVLCIGVVLTISQRDVPAGPNIERFKVLFPAADELADWTVVQRSIADTEEMKRAVGELLNYDAGRFVVYTKGDLQISIYAAYWKPGKMSPRLVATHTPDVCWLVSGWVRRTADFAVLQVAEGRSLQLKHRVFDSPTGTPHHVVFGHLVGGRPRDYGGSREPPWYALLSEIRWNGIRLREEQLFYRISSNQALTKFADEAPVRFFMSRLAPFLRTTEPDA
jgi:hypothetical protein